MSERRKVCETCDGRGFYFVLPSGVNPFLMRIESIAQRARRVECRDCAEGRDE